MDAFEAAKVLYQGGEKKDAFSILQKLWSSIEANPNDELRVFCALAEISCLQSPESVLELVENALMGEAGFKEFLDRRSISEQAVLLDWAGQLAFKTLDHTKALEFLSRSASLGRDTSLIWRILSQLYAESSDLELSIRYVKRSLQIYRQLDLSLVSGRDFPMGFFSGSHPLKLENQIEDYFSLLLRITKLAKGQKNLKGVREIVLEMMHQFPDEDRLPKIRNLLEKSLVESSMSYEGARRISLSVPGTF